MIHSTCKKEPVVKINYPTASSGEYNPKRFKILDQR
jgi:hypothetical protein